MRHKGAGVETALEDVTKDRTSAAGDHGPLVRLVDHTRLPYDLSIATARTCYSSKGIITPEDVSRDEKARALRDRIARSTLQAGHLTTRQHPHFVFTIERVSRHLVWSFLHSHPFYNSEQVSQRYVEVKPEQFHVPPSLSEPGRLPAHDIYLSLVRQSVADYQELIALLTPVASREFFRVFPARRAKPERWDSQIRKKAMEAARYVLPTAVHTFLYHTINGLTLHRYRRLAAAFDVPMETRLLVERMTEAVRQADPLYAAEMKDPLPLEQTLEFAFFEQFYGTDDRGGIRWNRDVARDFIRDFDRTLAGRNARLAGHSPEAVRTLADSVRAVLGLSRRSYSDADAIETVLNPARNMHLQSTLNESSVSRVTRALYNVQYTFQKKLSHTADSQDQRHRLVPGARPVLMSQYAGEPDFVTPALVRADGAAERRFAEMMAAHFSGLERFLEHGGSMEEATYLLPNAFPVRFYESGDLLNLHHKWKARTCYNAQEEIFAASVEELSQVHEVHPQLASWIKAPCWLRKRAGVTPYCPEGDRYCGVPVWNLELWDYKRVI